jgi:hypothetical protein
MRHELCNVRNNVSKRYRMSPAVVSASLESGRVLLLHSPMPLSFESVSHGELPFGFFNIDTDMLLLNDYFLFASDFCHHVTELARQPSDKPYRAAWSAHVMPYEVIGNLHGAIAGTDLSGFIGEVYRLFPFPREAAAFKQNPEGHSTREQIETLAVTFVPAQRIPVMVNPNAELIAVGNYAFNRPQFHALLRYVWLGGYPRWAHGVRPAYVIEMAAAAAASVHPLFAGIAFR